jgi:hypothetical protein
MIKPLAIALTITAVALSTSFAECGGGSCPKDGKKDKDAKKDQAVQVFNL